MARTLRRADRALDDVGNGEPGSRDTGLHEARKAYKRARYAVEVLARRAGKPARRLAKRISTLQDVLGTHQDSVMTRQALGKLAAQARETADDSYTYGLLHARQQAASERILRRLPAAVRRSRSSKNRRWINRAA